MKMVIETIGCEHLQLRNKLKGVALEKLVCRIIKFNRNDVSIKKILQLVKDKCEDYYEVKKPFKIGEKVYEKHQIFDKRELKYYQEVKVYDGSNSKWSRCDNCGQMYPKDKLNTKKCRKCKIGWFHVVKKEWVTGFSDSFKKVLSYLKENKLIGKPNFSLRADAFNFSNGIMTIFECKNKELSGLQYSDVISTLMYPEILIRSGYRIDTVRIIYNGTKHVSSIDDLISKLGFNVELIRAEDYLVAYGDGAKKVVINQVDGVYKYDILDSDKFLVDLSSINSPLMDKKNNGGKI